MDVFGDAGAVDGVDPVGPARRGSVRRWRPARIRQHGNYRAYRHLRATRPYVAQSSAIGFYGQTEDQRAEIGIGPLCLQNSAVGLLATASTSRKVSEPGTISPSLPDLLVGA